MQETYLLVDGNNLMFANQYASKKMSAGGVETTAVFGFLGSLRKLCERFEGTIKPVVLWDGGITWRHKEYKDYKGKRDLNPTLVAVKKALGVQRPILMDGLSALGVRQYRADDYEADDLAGWFSLSLAKRGKRVVLVTADCDWLQLVGEHGNISWFDPRTERWVQAHTFEAETQYANAEAFVEGKALAGDQSDNLPGVGGLGEKAAIAIFSRFQNVEDLMLRWPSYAVAAGHPLSRYKNKIQAFITSREAMAIFLRNRRFMDLRSVQIDPATILRSACLANEEMTAFKTWCGSLGFVSILKDLNNWIEPIHRVPDGVVSARVPIVRPLVTPAVANPATGAW